MPGQWYCDDLLNSAFELLRAHHSGGRSDLVSPGTKTIFGQTWLLLMLMDIETHRVRQDAASWFFRTKESYDSCEVFQLPVHCVSHWVLVVINFGKKSIVLYDSLNRDRQEVLEKVRMYALAVTKLYYPNSRRVEWALSRQQCPQQLNGDDCGPHTLWNAYCLSTGKALSALPRDFRYSILLNILCGKLRL
jgi:hypothetical protein